METDRPGALQRRKRAVSREAVSKEAEYKRIRRLEEEALDARDKIVLAAAAAARAKCARAEAPAKLAAQPRHEDLDVTPPPSPETCARNGIPVQRVVLSNSLSPPLSIQDFVDFELDSDEEVERLLNLAEDDGSVRPNVASTASRELRPDDDGATRMDVAQSSAAAVVVAGPVRPPSHGAVPQAAATRAVARTTDRAARVPAVQSSTADVVGADATAAAAARAVRPRSDAQAAATCAVARATDRAARVPAVQSSTAAVDGAESRVAAAQASAAVAVSGVAVAESRVAAAQASAAVAVSRVAVAASRVAAAQASAAVAVSGVAVAESRVAADPTVGVQSSAAATAAVAVSGVAVAESSVAAAQASATAAVTIGDAPTAVTGATAATAAVARDVGAAARDDAAHSSRVSVAGAVGPALREDAAQSSRVAAGPEPLPYDSPEARLARRTEYAKQHSSKWTPKSKKWKRLRQDGTGMNGLLPEGYFFVDRIIDVDSTDPANPRYQVLWADAPKEEKTAWLTKSDFTDIKVFGSDIRLILRMKAPPLSRAEFLKVDSEAQSWRTRRRSQGDDGEDGWCAFVNVGVALEQLGARNPVTAELIKAFTTEGARRRKVSGFPGVRWKALKTFILSLRRFGVKVDKKELNNPRHKKGQHGIQAIANVNLEPGIYLLGAFKNELFDLGHTIVLETEDDVTVHDEDVIGEVEDIMWVHAISFVYRIKLVEQ